MVPPSWPCCVTACLEGELDVATFTTQFVNYCKSDAEVRIEKPLSMAPHTNLLGGFESVFVDRPFSKNDHQGSIKPWISGTICFVRAWAISISQSKITQGQISSGCSPDGNIVTQIDGNS
jgi:hypothetical protein